MDQKTKRAEILKRLFEAQKAKVPTELAEEDRHKEAACLMDRLVGPDWRVEIQLPDITVMAVPPPPQDESSGKMSPAGAVSAVNQAAESFYERVIAAMDKEGLGPLDSFSWDRGADNDPKVAGKRVKLAERVLKGKEAGGDSRPRRQAKRGDG